MNKWVKDREKVLSGTMGALVVPSAFDKDDISRADDTEDVVIDELFQEGSEDLLGDVDATGDAEVQSSLSNADGTRAPIVPRSTFSRSLTHLFISPMA